MKSLGVFVIFLLFTGLSVFSKDEEKHDHDHSDIKASHGGRILEMSDENGFVEFLHDDKTGEVTIYILDPDGKAKKITEPPKLNLFIKNGETKSKKQIATAFKEADQKESDIFFVKDDALKTKELEGRVVIKIGEKNLQVEIKHDHHDHK